jgi:hypothetical protein
LRKALLARNHHLQIIAGRQQRLVAAPIEPRYKLQEIVRQRLLLVRVESGERLLHRTVVGAERHQPVPRVGIAEDELPALGLNRARRAAEQLLQPLYGARCLEALAELAFARKAYAACVAAADELLAIVRPSSMRELTAIALRWKGEGVLAAGRTGPAQAMLT